MHPIENPYLSPEPQDDDFGNLGDGESIRVQARAGMFITFGLAQGLIATAALMLFVLGIDGEPDEDPLFLYIGGGAAILMISTAILLPLLLRAKAVHDYRSSNEKMQPPIDIDRTPNRAASRLLGVYRGSTITSQACLEGAGIVNLVLMMLDNQMMIHLAIVGICLMGIIVQLPTAQRMKNLLAYHQ